MSIAIEKSIVSLNSSTLTNNYHLGWLDQIRGLAAIYVVCHHAVMQVVVIGDHAHDPFYRFLQLLTIYGHYAVDIFIVLSGYCLMMPVLMRNQFGNIWTFYFRRTIRIVLPYYAALGSTLILIYFLLGTNDSSHWASVSLPVSLISVLKHLLLVHQWFPETASKINPAFWSVGVEYQIYFLFPLLYWIAKKIGFVYSFLLITLTSYTLWGISYYLNIFNPSSTGASLYYCSLFFMGMTAAQYVSAEKDKSKLSYIANIDQNYKTLAGLAVIGIFFVAVVAYLVEHYAFFYFFPLQIQSFFVGLFFSFLIYLKGKEYNFEFLSCTLILKKLEWVGAMGFSVYLLHDPILAIVWKYIVNPMNLPFYWMQTCVELIIGVFASVITAMVFYKFVELPCHQLSKSIVKK